MSDFIDDAARFSQFCDRLDVLSADASTPMRTFTPTDDFYTPDCDHVAMPVPPGGNLEDETGYACSGDGDCHLLVFQTASKTLYEILGMREPASTAP